MARAASEATTPVLMGAMLPGDRGTGPAASPGFSLGLAQSGGLLVPAPGLVDPEGLLDPPVGSTCPDTVLPVVEVPLVGGAPMVEVPCIGGLPVD